MYELPQVIGNLPAGTYDCSSCEIDLYKSNIFMFPFKSEYSLSKLEVNWLSTCNNQERRGER